MPLSQTVTPYRTNFPLELDVLYGRSLCLRGKLLRVTGHNGRGQMVQTKWYRQNGMDKMSRTEWYGENGSNFWNKL